MKITDIAAQVKTPGRYSIFVDGKFSFGLSESALLSSGIRIGRELSQAELDKLRDTAKADKAYNMALALLARRPRSEWELREYLKHKDYEVPFIEEIMMRLQTGGWVNDMEFTRRWVANRRLLKSTSRRRLQQELRAKRVADAIIATVLAEDETDDLQVLQKLVAQKRKQSRYQDSQKLMAYLLRQGYSYGDVKEVLNWQSPD